MFLWGTKLQEYTLKHVWPEQSKQQKNSLSVYTRPIALLLGHRDYGFIYHVHRKSIIIFIENIILLYDDVALLLKILYGTPWRIFSSISEILGYKYFFNTVSLIFVLAPIQKLANFHRENCPDYACTLRNGLGMLLYSPSPVR